MFCNNCGAQIPDGIKFCNNCGAQQPIPNPVGNDDVTQAVYNAQPLDEQPTVQPPVYTQPPVQPPVYTQPPVQPPMPPVPSEEPPKKSKTGIIIAAVVAVIVVVGVILAVVFLTDNNNSDEDETTNPTSSSEVTTGKNGGGVKPSPIPTPSYDFDEAADVAEDYLNYYGKNDYVAIIDNEILGMDNISDIADEVLLDVTGVSSVTELYSLLSAGTGKTFNNFRDYFEFMMSEDAVEEEYKITSAIDDVTELSASEASSYVAKTKASIEEYTDADCVDWDDIEAYVLVEMTSEINDGSSTEKGTSETVLGYIDGEWKVIYITLDDEELGILSTYFLEGLVT